VAPIDVFTPEEVRVQRARFAALEAREGGQLSRRTNTRAHLLLAWVADIIRDPRVLDPVEDLIGGDILCWASGFFAKHPGDGTYISWHQDATYWGLSSPDVVTAWIALTPSTPESGCMRVMPGTNQAQLDHRDTFADKNLLSRGQEIAVEVDEAKAVDIVLAPGQMSLHHVLIVHGSKPNMASEARIGLAVRYIPTSLRQLSPIRDTATLVRGEDRFGHFEPEPQPAFDFAPEAVAFHAKVSERLAAITHDGIDRRRALDAPMAAPAGQGFYR
jgi:non-haem Fe2+, alpha-ketoglutarate-dependent halogenase